MNFQIKLILSARLLNLTCVSAFFFILVGCQIHKPVQVEYIATGVKQETWSAFNAQSYSPPQNPRYNSPEQTAWAPIDIQPLQIEPTQPLTEYKFKPRPSLPAKTQQSKNYTQPVSVSSGRQGYIHIVKRGENLYSIAKAYGLKVSQIAALNNLNPPYEIYPNQSLRVNGGTNFVDSGPATTKRPSIFKPTPVNSTIQWTWPANGQLLGGFQPGISNGIEIAGKAGVTIRASADGVVLYSGNEVTGYGELIIIDHGDGFMSTYAHNRKLLVAQGTQVKRGQKIAEMGSSEADRTKLHFEIRKGEKPVNPLSYLPKR